MNVFAYPLRAPIHGDVERDVARAPEHQRRSTRARGGVGPIAFALSLLIWSSVCTAQQVNAPASAPASTAAPADGSRGAPAGAPAAGRAPDAGRSTVTEFPSPGAPNRRVAASRGFAHPPPQRIDLFHGQARLLPIIGPVRRIAIGNGAVVGATSVEDGVLLLAEQAGASSIIVWTDHRVDEYLVTVTDQDAALSMRFLQSIVKDRPGVTVEQVGDRFVIRGAVYHSVRDEISAQLQGLPNVVNLLREEDGFPKKKTVHFKVQILELAKTVQQDLGILWDTQFAGPRIDAQGTALHGGIYNQLPPATDPTQPFTAGRIPSGVANAIGGAFIGIATNITSRINLALNNGEATVLAAPEVSTASGGEARFLAGGQVPIVTSSFGGTTVEYKDYGIILNIKPLVDADNNISASIETEVSQIDPSITYAGFPAFLTRKSRSDVSLRPFDTLAISGLVNSNWSRAADKVPFLGDVPVLGRLFRSDAFMNKRTDLVIFVTPEVTEPLGDTNRALIQRGREIGGRIPAVETDPRYTPYAPESTNISPAPSPTSPPPPATLPPAIPPPIPGGPGVPTPLKYGPVPEEDVR